MSTTLIERLGSLPSTVPSYIKVIPIDATYGAIVINSTSSGSNSPNVFNDTSQSWVTNVYAGYTIYILSGTGAGQTNTIVSNGTTSLVVQNNWKNIPDATSKYQITNVTDTSISSYIRQQPDYITVINPYIHIHSLMQNEFYAELCDALVTEYQYMIDRFNELKTLYNIDYYDGDQAAFMDKIANISSIFDFKVPLAFLPYTNVEQGDALDITKENDFLRNIVKRIWLMHRWVGSLNGYNLPIKLIHRIGTVHLGLINATSGSIQVSTNRIYRIVNPESYNIAIPGTTSSVYPISPNIEGLISFSDIPPSYLRWDTGQAWDVKVTQNNTFPIAWDSKVLITNAGKRLFIEIALDRLLLHTNSVNTHTSLLENIFLDTVNTLLQEVTRAQDTLQIGTQMTLVTNKDGRFNSLSGSDAVYSHPNIQAKFQVFQGRWTSASNSSYIKIGSGGYTDFASPVSVQQSVVTSSTSTSITDSTQTWTTNWANYSVYILSGTGAGQTRVILSNNTTTINISATTPWSPLPDTTSVYRILGTVDTNVFVKVGESVSAQYKTQLIDLQNPLYSSPILIGEISNLGTYTLVNTVVHSRSFNTTGNVVNMIINGSNMLPTLAYTTTLQFVHTYIAPGSVQVNININVLPQAPTISADAGTQVTFTLTSGAVDTIYTILVTHAATAGGNVYIVVSSGTITIPVYNNWTTSQIAAAIAGTIIPNWRVVATGATVTMISIINDIHQRLFMYEQIDPIAQIYNPKYRVQNMIAAIPTVVVSTAPGIGIGPITKSGVLPYSYSFTISSVISPQSGTYITINNTIIDIYETDTYQSIAERIVATTIPNWTISWGTSIISNVTVYTIYMVYINPYTELANTSTYFGYTMDNTFENLSSNSYLPTAQLQALLPLQLYNIDMFPSLYENLIGDYRNDTSSITTLTDSYYNQQNGTVHGTVSVITGYVKNGYSYDGSTAYITVADSLALNRDMPKTNGMSLAFSYNLNTNANTSTVLVAKQTSSFSAGWGLYMTYSSGSTATLTFKSAFATTNGTWTIAIPATGWHRITLAFSATTGPGSILVYVDGIIVTATAGTVGSGVYLTDSGLSLLIGGFSASSYNYKGYLSDIRIWDRVLNTYELTNEITAIKGRLTLMYDTLNNPQYFYVDHVQGAIGMKLQYNPNGMLSNTYEATSPSNYVLENMYIDEQYKLGTITSNVAITEIGIFDGTNTMVAYATFPPVIYNSNNYHLAFNLLIAN
jgi:hypothetical protein